MAAAFFDSDITVCAVDPRTGSDARRAIARGLLRERDAVFSTQVLLETFNILVRRDLMDSALARTYVRRLSLSPVITLEREDVIEALEHSDLHRLRADDCLIVRAAEKAGVSVLYSEALPHGQTFGSVRVCNPFIEDFLA